MISNTKMNLKIIIVFEIGVKRIQKEFPLYYFKEFVIYCIMCENKFLVNPIAL